jgi:Family of unknown function (DUF5335)
MTDSKELREGAFEDELPSATRDLANRNADVDIQRGEWASFLDSFSLQHEGWFASLSVTRESNISNPMSSFRLQGIATDRATGKFRLNITVREGPDQRIYSVPDPSQVILKRDATGAHQGLEIVSADGSVTFLRFRAAMRPECLDGVLPT